MNTNVIFLDIETFPEKESFTDLDQKAQELFLKRFDKHRKTYPARIVPSFGVGQTVSSERLQTDQELYEDQASLHAEYCQIKCVCIGTMPVKETDPQPLFIKQLYGENEYKLLQDVSTTIENIKTKASPHFFPLICGHNLKRFDAPVLARRSVIHRLPIQPEFNTMGKKPWDIPMVDTMELWSFGDFKYSIGLAQLAHTLGLPGPKDILEGLSVLELYRKYGLQKIAEYCAGDVVTTINIYRLLHGAPPIENVRIFDDNGTGKASVSESSPGGVRSGAAN